MSDDLVKRLRELAGELADRIEADRAAMQKMLDVCSAAEYAITFAPESYEQWLTVKHDSVSDLRVALAALRERLK